MDVRNMQSYRWGDAKTWISYEKCARTSYSKAKVKPQPTSVIIFVEYWFQEVLKNTHTKTGSRMVVVVVVGGGTQEVMNSLQ